MEQEQVITRIIKQSVTPHIVCLSQKYVSALATTSQFVLLGLAALLLDLHSDVARVQLFSLSQASGATLEGFDICTRVF